MMWSTIANLKENLNKIALDVHEEDDDDEELGVYASPDRDVDSVSDRRRYSRSFSRSRLASHSPSTNGFDSTYKTEMEQYEAEINRLRGSEAEIKALSVNYAALLKDKEDEILRLNEENRSVKHDLKATSAALVISNGQNGLKENNAHSPTRLQKAMEKNRSIGNQTLDGFSSKQDGLSNGSTQRVAKAELKHSITQSKEKELADLIEEKNKFISAIQTDHESQLKKLSVQLNEEREKLVHVQQNLQEERKLNFSLQEELNSLKVDKDKILMEMSSIRKELENKISSERQLQNELNRKDEAEAGTTLESLRREIAILKNENSNLKEVKEAGSLSENKEAELTVRTMEKELKETRKQRDKALQQLNRLKQHLLEKESEESEKMDEDSKVIKELQEKNEYQRLQISNLEKALKQAIAGQEEVKMANKKEIHDQREVIDGLKAKLASCMRTIDAKNVELLNLQTALGQYYAEIEAKEFLERELSKSREDSAKLSGLLEDAHQQAEILNREKEDMMERYSRAELMLLEGKKRVNKLEEDNGKLRRAFEQSMSRINRMSVDSDYYVDRRIVIKLLVTYLQRNHSKEVLELMVRMLGFSEEDKKRIGVAQQGSKGVVRGVLGFPGRLVGGILGSSNSGSGESPAAAMASENQSFADLWVDFLLKETEERERRELAAEMTTNESNKLDNERYSSVSSSFPNHGGIGRLVRDESDSEFSSIPLTSSEKETSSRSPMLQRH
ncbi:golgin candidate 4-like isoform X2 [Impatiens glandulifera]|uniref:golgin candidate 4-like isoform X2 n=1 Tax=Impatiens glandulifera TaxID=253017 RepID=UPI001FB16A1D|nr:golgin candidate 4-like isoform X2 [Impatiens glandulifera]